MQNSEEVLVRATRVMRFNLWMVTMFALGSAALVIVAPYIKLLMTESGEAIVLSIALLVMMHGVHLVLDIYSSTLSWTAISLFILGVFSFLGMFLPEWSVVAIRVNAAFALIAQLLLPARPMMDSR